MNQMTAPALVLAIHVPQRVPKFYIDFMLTNGNLIRLPVFDCHVDYDLDDQFDPNYEFDEMLTADSVRSQLIYAMQQSQQFPEGYVRHYAEDVLPLVPDEQIMENLFYYN